MQLVILAGFILSGMMAAAPSQNSAPWVLLLSATLYFAGVAALSGCGARFVLRAMYDHDQAGKAQRKQKLIAVFSRLWLLGGLAIFIHLGYGRWVMDDLSLKKIPLIGDWMIFAPFLLAVLLHWFLDYPLHRETRRRMTAHSGSFEAAIPVWSRREYLLYNIRHHMLFILVPISLILLIEDLVLMYLYPVLPEPYADPITLAGVAIGAFGVFLIAPLLIVRTWSTRRLPDGELRDILQAVCDKLDMGFREMYIWRSGGVIANAGVIGLLPQMRFVLLSDALLEKLSDKQIRAIFAHEAGHVVHKHILYAVLFLVGLMVFSGVISAAATDLLGFSLWGGQFTAVSLLILLGGVGFGWISRRFERQSDVMGAKLAAATDQHGEISPEGAAIFSQALQEVGMLNGVSPRRRNWRHGSIGWRVSYILNLGVRGGNAAEIDNQVRRIKRFICVLLAVSIVLALLQFYMG